ncbi:preprotein translocase subunit YajC [Hymenobacter psychrotolerans]|uniref:Sec translocon accessory complex subunit YajC n=1 Tax=Hymenobacter psychrotolerans DSM 18569 TaxID=1121959 RepID=A0A1M6PYK4_9BACT|nr:preprotein translocase subunit YajC [Hymenobacter psychrotolerans]SHK13018.1 preprotein translocase subunit YajC [Hymenobacter psychrotolerans DSM 18569]
MFATLFLQAAAPSSANSFLSYLFPVAIAVIMYFFMIRPQQRKAAEAKKFRESIAKGATVVTIGGLHGKVLDLSDDAVIIEVDRGTKLKFDRSAIAREVKPAKAAADAPATSA